MRQGIALAMLSAVCAAQTISVPELMKRVPLAAMREYRASQKAFGRGELDRAIAHLERALEMDAANVEARLDLALLYVHAGRADKAEGAALRAVELAPENRRAHLLLGWSLATQHKYSVQALQSLRRAAREFPAARLAAADVLVHQGALDEARREVEAYLASADDTYRETAKSWLQILTLE